MNNFFKKVKEEKVELSTKVKRFRWKLSKKKTIVLLIAIVGVVIFSVFLFGKNNRKMKVSGGTDAIVSKQNIEVTLSSSGTVQPANQYSITSSVSGKILECLFEKGDIVSEDDVLYRIDSSDMENTVTRANISYTKTYNNYLDTMESKDKVNIYSQYDGTIVKLYVEPGDDVNNGTKIADVRNSDVMKLTVPFNSVNAQVLSVGDRGIVTLDSTFEQLECWVTKIDGIDTILSGNRLIRYVEVEVNNPGAINTSSSGTVIIGNVACSGNGTFEYSSENTITAQTNGSIKTLNAKQGSKVKANEIFGTIESSSLQEQLSSSELSLEDAKLSYENTLSKLDDYTIKAPITGTVITKNVKVGDNLNNNSNSSTLAVIYDLSYLTFDISVDELDIGKIKVGQSVKISCDAVTSGDFEGVVSNVSVAGTTQNGVTTYPVTVQIPEPPEELLPGMNVEALIVVESTENAIAIPVDALQRGNVVYVKSTNSGNANNEEVKPGFNMNNVPDGYSAVKVEVGISNDNYVEIISGLLEGDVVYVSQAERTSTTTKNEESEFNFSMPGMSGNMGSGTGTRPTGNMGGGMPGGGF